MGLLYSPAQADIGNTGSFLRQHKILNSTNEVKPISYLYSVEILDGESWQVKICENTHLFDGPVGKLYELVSWDFSGELTEAIQQMERQPSQGTAEMVPPSQ